MMILLDKSYKKYFLGRLHTNKVMVELVELIQLGKNKRWGSVLVLDILNQPDMVGSYCC